MGVLRFYYTTGRLGVDTMPNSPAELRIQN